MSLIQHAVDTNLVGMQLMIGFAQVANNKEAQQHFVRGMKLSKKIETELGDILRHSYIEPRLLMPEKRRIQPFLLFQIS